MLTKDLVPVVVHDEELGRTVAGSGLICDMLARDLFQLDAGSWFGPGLAHVRVPAYRDVLQFCAGHGIWMNVEIKPAKGFEAITGKVVADLTSDFYGTSSQALPLFSSFALDALAVAQERAPHISRGVLFDKIPPDWQQQIDKFKAVSLHTNHRHLTPEAAAQIKQAGIGLSCYTVNEVARAREILGWGVDAIFTDNLRMDLDPDKGNFA